ncbi:MAG: peptidoglycan-binding protein [Firmicutes bacterium]|nr:peptidoglycan-binding protein [Bacillota bacterium]
MKKFLLSLILAVTMLTGILPATTVSAATAVWPTLSQNSSGEEVRALQYLLKSAGKYSATPNASFDSATKTAVINYQAANNLSQNGVVDTATWTALTNKIVKKGSIDSNAVYAIQYLLNKKFGFSSIALDGVFGVATKATVHRFQVAISQTPSISTNDGIVGPITWKNLIGISKTSASISAWWYVYVELPSNRDNLGKLYLYDSTGGSLLSSALDCKGKGATGTADWLTVNSNTPLGCFKGDLSAAAEPPSSSYGLYRVVKLDDGDINGVAPGRSGIWIHSHAASDAIESDNTHGCLLLRSTGHKILADALANTGMTRGFVIICE